MRKLLGLIGALGLVASGSSVVVSCGSSNDAAANDISKGIATSDKDSSTTANLKVDSSDDSVFTGSITAGSTYVNLDFSGLTTDQKGKEITPDAAATGVYAAATDTSLSSDFKLTQDVTKSADDKTGPSIKVSFDTSSTKKAFEEKNVVAIAFTFDGMKENTVKLTVNAPKKASLPSKEVQKITIGDTAISSDKDNTGTYNFESAPDNDITLDLSGLTGDDAFVSPSVKLAGADMKAIADETQKFTLDHTKISSGAEIKISSTNYSDVKITLTITGQTPTTKNDLTQDKIKKIKIGSDTIKSSTDGEGTYTFTAVPKANVTLDLSGLTGKDAIVSPSVKLDGNDMSAVTNETQKFTLDYTKISDGSKIKILSTNYNEVTITLTVTADKTDLKTIIKDANLSITLKATEAKATLDEVTSALSKKYTELNMDQVTVKLTDSGANVVAKNDSTKYTGSVDLTLKLTYTQGDFTSASFSKITSNMGTIAGTGNNAANLTLDDDDMLLADATYTITVDSGLTPNFVSATATGDKTKTAVSIKDGVFTLAAGDFVETKTIKIKSSNYKEITITIKAAETK